VRKDGNGNEMDRGGSNGCNSVPLTGVSDARSCKSSSLVQPTKAKRAPS